MFVLCANKPGKAWPARPSSSCATPALALDLLKFCLYLFRLFRRLFQRRRRCSWCTTSRCTAPLPHCRSRPTHPILRRLLDKEGCNFFATLWCLLNSLFGILYFWCVGSIGLMKNDSGKQVAKFACFWWVNDSRKNSVRSEVCSCLYAAKYIFYSNRSIQICPASREDSKSGKNAINGQACKEKYDF